MTLDRTTLPTDATTKAAIARDAATIAIRSAMRAGEYYLATDLAEEAARAAGSRQIKRDADAALTAYRSDCQTDPAADAADDHYLARAHRRMWQAKYTNAGPRPDETARVLELEARQPAPEPETPAQATYDSALVRYLRARRASARAEEEHASADRKAAKAAPYGIVATRAQAAGILARQRREELATALDALRTARAALPAATTRPRETSAQMYERVIAERRDEETATMTQPELQQAQSDDADDVAARIARYQLRLDEAREEHAAKPRNKGPRAAIQHYEEQIQRAREEQPETQHEQTDADADETRRERAAAAGIDAYAEAIDRTGSDDDARWQARNAAISTGATADEAAQISQLASTDYTAHQATEAARDGAQEAANRDADEQRHGIGRPHPETRDHYEPDPPYTIDADPDDARRRARADYHSDDADRAARDAYSAARRDGAPDFQAWHAANDAARPLVETGAQASAAAYEAAYQNRQMPHPPEAPPSATDSALAQEAARRAWQQANDAGATRDAGTLRDADDAAEAAEQYPQAGTPPTDAAAHEQQQLDAARARATDPIERAILAAHTPASFAWAKAADDRDAEQAAPTDAQTEANARALRAYDDARMIGATAATAYDRAYEAVAYTDLPASPAQAARAAHADWTRRQYIEAHEAAARAADAYVGAYNRYRDNPTEENARLNNAARAWHDAAKQTDADAADAYADAHAAAYSTEPPAALPVPEGTPGNPPDPHAWLLRIAAEQRAIQGPGATALIAGAAAAEETIDPDELEANADDDDGPPSLRETRLSIWQERDRLTIALVDKRDDRHIVGWIDDAAHEAIDDGTLSHRAILGRLSESDARLHQSAYDYADENGLLTGDQDGPSYTAEPEEEPDEPDEEQREELTAEHVQNYLTAAIEGYDSDGDDESDRLIRRIESYADAGILTRDAGFVLTTTDDRQWQITIVRSR